MSGKTSKAPRQAAQAASLASQYNAVGPAAIVAALLCMPRTRVTVASRPAKVS